MYEYFCTNPICTEVGVVKIGLDLMDPLPLCSGRTSGGDVCGERLTTDGVENPHNPPPTLDERVTELEEFDADLVAALEELKTRVAALEAS